MVLFHSYVSLPEGIPISLSRALSINIIFTSSAFQVLSDPKDRAWGSDRLVHKIRADQGHLWGEMDVSHDGRLVTCPAGSLMDFRWEIPSTYG